jgi:hypothetical protein
VVRTLRCVRNNPGSNPGHGILLLLHLHVIFLFLLSSFSVCTHAKISKQFCNRKSSSQHSFGILFLRTNNAGTFCFYLRNTSDVTKYLVADATLFDFILVSYSTLVYEYIRYTLFFAWDLHCGCIFKVTRSLLAEELSCCGCC